MATVIITLTDDTEDGKDILRVRIESDPPFPQEVQDMTIAQLAANECAGVLQQFFGEESESTTTYVDEDGHEIVETNKNQKEP